LREHFGALDDSFNRDLDDIARSYLQAGHDFAVAEWRGNLVGTGALVRENRDVGRLARLSVQAHFRRRGIGRALVNHLLRLAHQRGYGCVLTETNHDWHEAKALYQGVGFQEYATSVESVHMKLELIGAGATSVDKNLSPT